MHNATHFTSKQDRQVTVTKVIRSQGHVHVGTITQLHRGWEANHGGGVRIVHATKLEAFEAIVAADLAVGAQRKQR